MIFSSDIHYKSGTPVTLAILAGGKASRLGGVSKAIIEINGQPLIRRVYDSLAGLFSEVIVIYNDSLHLPVEAKVYSDIYKETGPLGGIHSALKHATFRDVFIVSVDMPFASMYIANQIVSRRSKNPESDIFVPKVGKYAEPLFGIYSKSIISQVEDILNGEGKFSVSRLLEVCSTCFLELPLSKEVEKAFFNINTYEDLMRLKVGL